MQGNRQKTHASAAHGRYAATVPSDDPRTGYAIQFVRAPAARSRDKQVPGPVGDSLRIPLSLRIQTTLRRDRNHLLRKMGQLEFGVDIDVDVGAGSGGGGGSVGASRCSKFAARRPSFEFQPGLNRRRGTR